MGKEPFKNCSDIILETLDITGCASLERINLDKSNLAHPFIFNNFFSWTQLQKNSFYDKISTIGCNMCVYIMYFFATLGRFLSETDTIL